MQFAVALSRQVDTDAAALEVAAGIRTRLGSTPIDLACVFFSPHHTEGAGRLVEVLTGTLLPKLLLGCSGEGVIAGAEELETTPAITVWASVLPDVHLHPLHSSFSPTQDQFHLTGWPDPSIDDGTFLLLADPFTTPIQDILGILDDRYPAAKAIGGLAGGGQEVGTNCLVLNDQIFDGGLVGVRLSGAVDIRPVISQGCRLIGERFVVTKAERNLIHELGGEPALERLKAVFDSLPEGERQRAHRAVHLGIVIDEHRNRFDRGDFLIRNLLGADRTTGAVAIGEMVQEGQTVQFQLRDAASASDEFNSLLEADHTRHRYPPLGALMFSCCGRGQGLFGKPNHDAGTASARLGSIPLAGFFAQGEIGPVGGRNFLHGYTASLALFSERDR